MIDLKLIKFDRYLLLFASVSPVFLSPVEKSKGVMIFMNKHETAWFDKTKLRKCMTSHNLCDIYSCRAA